MYVELPSEILILPGANSDLLAWYTNVRRFLNSGSGSAGADRPYLFCQHTWLTKKKMTDIAWDYAGEEFPAPDLSGKPAKIQDVDIWVQRQAESAGGTPVSFGLERLESFGKTRIDTC